MNTAFDDLEFQHIKEYLWRKGDLRYKLWEQQKVIYDTIRDGNLPGEEVVILCARQYGKSHLGVALGLEDCLRYPDSCILIVGPTIKQTREIVTPRLRRIAKDAPEGLIRPSKSEGKWFVGDSELVMGGFDQSASAQRGKTVQNIYIEEIVDAHPDDYVEAIRSDIGPALTHSKGGKIFYLTTLPKIPDHPFIVDTMVRAQMNGSFFSFTIDDNKELSEEQYNACVSRAGGRHTVDFRREYLNEIIRDPSVIVVPEFDPAKHVAKVNMPPKYMLFNTIDFGGVRDKTVALLHTYDYNNDIDLFLDERVYDANTPTNTIVNELVAMENTQEVQRFADVPGQLSVDLNNAGYVVSSPVKSDWKAGINYLNVRFAQDKIIIDPKCQFLRMSLESGTFNKQKTDFERTTALGHCDAIAAIMYAVRSRPTKNPYATGLPRPMHLQNQIYTNVETTDKPKDFGFKHRKFGAFSN